MSSYNAKYENFKISFISYVKEAERQQNNPDHYRKLQEDPTTNMKLVNDTIERLKNKKL